MGGESLLGVFFGKKQPAVLEQESVCASWRSLHSRASTRAAAETSLLQHQHPCESVCFEEAWEGREMGLCHAPVPLWSTFCPSAVGAVRGALLPWPGHSLGWGCRHSKAGLALSSGTCLLLPKALAMAVSTAPAVPRCQSCPVTATGGNAVSKSQFFPLTFNVSLYLL